jgi:prepilin-type N-terminal cleavage/methylation domain-containing protein
MQTAHRTGGHSDAGFTLIELLLVVTIIGILASIAMPSLSRARGVAAEMATISSLRTIHTAQMAYATSCGAGYYAPSIPWLARTVKVKKGAMPPAFIGPEFTANTTDRLRYRIRFTLGTRAKNAAKTCNGLTAGQAANTFFVGADLLQAKYGMVSRYFGINQDGIVYQSKKRIAPFYAGTPKAPAVPVQ